MQWYLLLLTLSHNRLTVEKYNLIWTCVHPENQRSTIILLFRVQQQFVWAVPKLLPICKDPKIASQLCVPAGIRPHDSVRSACGMQRQALRLRLDAYHNSVSSDWMLTITISCCWLMGWPLQYQHGMPSQGETGLSLNPPPPQQPPPLGSFSKPVSQKKYN